MLSQTLEMERLLAQLTRTCEEDDTAQITPAHPAQGLCVLESAGPLIHALQLPRTMVFWPALSIVHNKSCACRSCVPCFVLLYYYLLVLL